MTVPEAIGALEGARELLREAARNYAFAQADEEMFRRLCKSADAYSWGLHEARAAKKATKETNQVAQP